MNLYGGRISLLREEGNIFYQDGKEKNLEYFIQAMSRHFEVLEKYGVYLINEPWIHAEKGFIGGSLGRVGHTKLPQLISGHFDRKSEIVYPHVRYLFIRSQQTLLVEKNSSVFHDPEKVFEYLSNYLNTVLTYEGLSVHIHPLTSKGEFWNVLNDLLSVHEIRLRFVMPNFLGDMYSDIKKLLGEVNKETNATEIETTMFSSSGRLEVPRNSGYQSAVGWIEDGGGTWEVTRKGTHGKRRKKVSNKKSLTIFERQIDFDGLTMDELAELISNLDIGPHTIIKEFEQE